MSRIGYLQAMIVQVNLPDELVAKIDRVAQDRTAFVSEAVRRLLHDGSENPTENETARINELADELNREALDVLEYQVIS
jgi:metal-responsive CopG/Arc/MetJ family transcriptional regulator